MPRESRLVLLLEELTLDTVLVAGEGACPTGGTARARQAREYNRLRRRPQRKQIIFQSSSLLLQF